VRAHVNAPSPTYLCAELARSALRAGRASAIESESESERAGGNESGRVDVSGRRIHMHARANAVRSHAQCQIATSVPHATPHFERRADTACLDGQRQAITRVPLGSQPNRQHARRPRTWPWGRTSSVGGTRPRGSVPSAACKQPCEHGHAARTGQPTMQLLPTCLSEERRGDDRWVCDVRDCSDSTEATVL
jgi:hypothetical protein